MKNATFTSEALKSLLLKRKIASLEQLKHALGTHVSMTVFRKLKPLAYLTSYSHNGRYYTLESIARFDDNGLWSCQDIYFSVYNTLIGTVEAFVTNSVNGYTRDELEEVLHVKAQESLLKLFENDRIQREKVGRQFIYFSSDVKIVRQQKLARQDFILPYAVDSDLLAHELKAAIVLFFATLDEQQRRLYAGMESLKMGQGGDKEISRFLGIDPHTVAKGRRALLEKDVEIDRIRSVGGGRHTVEKKRRKLS